MKLEKVLYQPLYLQVKKGLIKYITKNKLAPGTFLPPEQKLSSMLGVNRLTVRRALHELKQEGLISQHQGRGTIVREPKNTGPIVGVLGNPEEMDFFNRPSIYSQLMAGLTSELVDKHGGIICYRRKDSSRNYAELFAGIKLDAIIITGIQSREKEAIQGLEECGVPVIICDQGFGQKWLNVVRGDGETDARKAVDFLLREGHRRIVCAISKNASLICFEKRMRGYVSALKKAGLSSKESFYYGDDKNFLSSFSPGEEPTGVFMVSSPLGKELVKEMNERGLLDEHKICVAGFEDTGELSDIGVAYYSLQVPAFEIGKRTGKRVMQLRKQELTRPFKDIIPFTCKLHRGNRYENRKGNFETFRPQNLSRKEK